MEPRSQTKNTSRSYLLAALIILAALNVLLFSFWYQERQENKTKDAALKTQDATIAAKTEEVLAATTRLDSISTQLDAKIAEIRQLGGNISSLMKAKQQLEADKRELRNLSSFNSRKYDRKIQSYQTLLAQKDQEITRLKAENGALAQQNQTLMQENSGLKAERQTLSDSVVAVETRNKELNQKVTIAAALHAERVTVSAINARGKERDGGSYRARQLDKIRISVRMAPNALARQDEKDLYVRVLDPSGAVISDRATGSGDFTYNGQGMIYTAMQRFAFDNSRQQVDFIYGRAGKPFNEGRHTVEVYCEGFRIGEGEFTVK
ncbi:MAG TPA: hypothetical protein VK404_18970 [Spirosoma sp.]|jgi:predicted nuclease with TOPRIM domain|nr:hypothetical protein [Spirosoma sp.]